MPRLQPHGNGLSRAQDRRGVNAIREHGTAISRVYWLAAAVVLGSRFPATAQQPGVTAESIMIGTFGALTGLGYLYGKLVMNGVEVVFDEVNAAGGIHGRKLQLLREDDRCDAAAAIGAIQKLVH
jgi:branched-chain amino acid transport system substrate-binding protein